MNILFTICARAGSKGVKGKNTRLLCGRPLAYYTIAAFEEYKIKYPDTQKISLAVNTDSELLNEQINHTGIEYLSVERKDSLAGDIVAKKDVIKDTLKEAEQLSNVKYDIVVDLDLTSPLRAAEDIKGTIQALLEDEGADIAYTVVESRRSPYFNMVSKNENGYYSTVIASEFVARQQVPACYEMNASIYAYRRDYLLSSRLNERNAKIWVMKDTGILDIDSEHDLKFMELTADYVWSNDTAYLSVKKRAETYTII